MGIKNNLESLSYKKPAMKVESKSWTFTPPVFKKITMHRTTPKEGILSNNWSMTVKTTIPKNWFRTGNVKELDAMIKRMEGDTKNERLTKRCR